MKYPDRGRKVYTRLNGDQGRPVMISKFWAARKSLTLAILGFALAIRLISSNRKRIIALAGKWKLPAMCYRPSWGRSGCLMSYGADRLRLLRRAATYVDKILKGAKRADLPVEQPTRFYLTLNLKTAKALGITFPRSILLRADKVIE